MLLTPHEQEKLLLLVAAGVARQRRARGVKLNQPEAVALLSLGARGRPRRRGPSRS